MKMRRLLAIIIAGTVLTSATPVFGADEDVLELDVLPIEESEEISTSEDALEGEVMTDSISEEVESVGALIEEGPEEWVSDVPLDTVEVLGAEENSIQADGASASTGFKYYSQCAYKCATGYNVIAAYIKNKDAEGYKSRLFFVYDEEYKEWLRYDYSQMAAETFLSEYEVKDTLYIPVVRTSGDQIILQGDNPDTAVDEGKIPVLNEADVDGINFAWKALSEIPFVKDGNVYEYAGEGSKEEDPDPDPDPEPVPTPEERTTSVEINGHKYTIIWTGKVQYDGRAHIWNQANVSAKNASKQVADVKVEVIRDGALVSPSNYTVTFKNNVNVTGCNGKSNYQPYFTISLKGTYKKDNSRMSKGKLPFDITPCPVTSGTLQAKKVVVQGNKTTFTDLYFVFSDGRKVKMAVYNAKKKTGTFTATATDDGVQITGYNNFSESGMLSMANPKKVTYEW